MIKFISCLLLVISVNAFGLPSSLDIKCGDMTRKEPFDHQELAGEMSIVVLSGHADAIPSSEIKGYYAGGIGYKIGATIQDADVLGIEDSIAVDLTCFAKSVSDREMTCSSNLKQLPSVVGFNMLKATLPVPTASAEKAYTVSEFYVRKTKYIKIPGRSGAQFFKNSREMMCTFSNVVQ